MISLKADFKADNYFYKLGVIVSCIKSLIIIFAFVYGTNISPNFTILALFDL